MLKSNIFDIVNCIKYILKVTFICFFFLNLAAKKLKITYVACIVFSLDTSPSVFFLEGWSICATFLANPHNLITTHFIKEKSVLTSIMLVDQISDPHQI